MWWSCIIMHAHMPGLQEMKHADLWRNSRLLSERKKQASLMIWKVMIKKLLRLVAYAFVVLVMFLKVDFHGIFKKSDCFLWAQQSFVIRRVIKCNFHIHTQFILWFQKLPCCKSWIYHVAYLARQISIVGLDKRCKGAYFQSIEDQLRL